MPQFTVYRNPNPETKAAYPLLLDVQNDLIADLNTRVVAPLCPASAMKGKLIKTLTPLFEIDGEQYAMLTPQLAGIAKKQIGAKVADLAQCRDEIIAALDLLITGI
jgi:toxin CcdB